MEFRRIQFTGRSSYIVSLPKKWVLENNLKQGDIVPLVINPDGSITILPKEPRGGSEKKELEISKEYSPDMAVRLVVSAYIQGYNTLEIRFLDEMPSYKVEIRKILQLLPGIEIILDEPQRIIAKSLLDEKGVNLGEILSRIRSIVLSMIEDLELLANNPGESEILRDLNDLENELDRFYFLTIRTVNKLLSRGISPEDSDIVRRDFDLIGILFIVRNIERIGDHIVRISEKPEVLDYSRLREFFTAFMERIYDRDLKTIDRLMLELKKIIQSTDSKKSTARESYRRILEYLENIGETVINMALS
ncbi:phosphate uptake regulator PhoU [Thermococcus waiotapuensis]|uniref:Phosphate uptake regulator PhoU n=1 Tax=Thermococcus waiotapuensis TaxID=90909 RepID=A0AAE4NWV9_9EURY|nr:phosphate uptake regulator PhoU [Thermococcus waiotapuensis]MDV3104162.1 phosphate uptake regulator PhoU [Thermococcus waiotapuensis]